MAVDTRGIPLASAWVYFSGCGDPPVTDWGTWRYDFIEENERFGTYSRDANGVSYLRVIPDVGLVCREYYVPQNTRLASYTTSGGAWEERIPAVGRRVYHLVQYSSAAHVVWSATSTYTLPANPSLALAFFMADTPPDHDHATYPPYVACYLGGNTSWAIVYWREQGGKLLQYTGGAWVERASLPEPQAPANSAVALRVLFLRVQRGRICVSLDFGKTWEVVAASDGSALSIPSGTLKFAGQGMAAILGVHQLRYYSGTYTSQALETFTSRSHLLSPPTYTYRGALNGGAVAVADPLAGIDSLTQYRATLTPVVAGAAPFSLYRSPEVYAVSTEHPVVWGLDSASYSLSWDEEMLSVDVEKPYDLGDATATVVVNRDPSVNYSGGYRWRKVRLWLSHTATSGGDPALVNAFTGYVRDEAVDSPEYGVASVAYTLDSVTVRPKQTKWEPVRGIPVLGGLTVNQALDACLEYCGIPTSQRSWDAAGDVIDIPEGEPDDPTEWPREGEPVWETMGRVALYAGLEAGARDDGVFVTVPIGYTAPVVSFLLSGDPESQQDANALILSGQNQMDYAATFTTVIAAGTDATGGRALAFVRDVAAEDWVTSPRYSGIGRTVYQENVPGTVTSGLLAAVSQSLAREKLLLAMEPDVSTLVQLGINRRDRGILLRTNLGVNIGAGVDPQVERYYRVLTLSHHYEPEPASCQTTAGMREIVP